MAQIGIPKLHSLVIIKVLRNESKGNNGNSDGHCKLLCSLLMTRITKTSNLVGTGYQLHLLHCAGIA